MSKTPDLSDITNIYTSPDVHNANNDKLIESFTNTLSRDGSTPNNMEADLDMNSNDILNTNSVQTTTLILDGVDIGESISDSVAAAAASADAAATSETNAEDSATQAAASAAAADESQDKAQGYADDAAAYAGERHYQSITLLQASDDTYADALEGDIYTIRKGGHAYVVAAEGATDEHISTYGTDGTDGLKFYVHGEITPSKMGAPDGADPSGRELYAPAMATAKTDREQYGVTLRELLGWDYSEENDAAAALNGFTAELAPAGIQITDPDGMVILCEEKLIVRDNLKLSFSPTTEIRRGFATTEALIGNEDFDVDVDGFEIRGGHWTTVDSDQTGRMFNIYGNEWTVSGLRISEFYPGTSGGMAMVFGGNNIALDQIYARTASTEGGTGAFRCAGGNGGVFSNLRGFVGDDVFQFTPATGVGAARYGQSIRNMSYVNCYGESSNARLMVAGMLGTEDAHLIPGVVQHCNFIAVNGSGTQRTISVENTECDGNTPGAVGWIGFKGCHIDGSNQDQSQTASIDLLGDTTAGNLGPITFDDCHLYENVREAGVNVDRCDRLVLRDSSITAEANVATADYVGQLLVSGGSSALEDHGGGHTASYPYLIGSSGVVDQFVMHGHKIDGVPTSRAGVRTGANNTTGKLQLRDAVVDKATGATSTYGVSVGSGTFAIDREITGTRDTEAQGTALRATYA